jgi:hypothetical protein
LLTLTKENKKTINTGVLLLVLAFQ